jgi:hypothetical protein
MIMPNALWTIANGQWGFGMMGGALGRGGNRPATPGAVQTCGIASSRRALSAYPIFIAPGFIHFSENVGLIRSAYLGKAKICAQ